MKNGFIVEASGYLLGLRLSSSPIVTRFKRCGQVNRERLKSLADNPFDPKRIVVSDPERQCPGWFGGQDRPEASLDAWYEWLGPAQRTGIRLVVIDRWKAFEKSTRRGDSVR